MSTAVSYDDSEVLFEKLVSAADRRPPCDPSGQFPYTRRWAKNPERAYCAKIPTDSEHEPTGFWDATIPARDGDLTSVVQAGVSLILLQKSSLMYHGYGGEKMKDRPRVANAKHDNAATYGCEKDDTIPCHKRTRFPWLRKLMNSDGDAIKTEPMFLGPKTSADVYGKNKQNTVVVTHRNPSGSLGRASQTADQVFPLYQVPELNGTTITFSLTKDTKLVDLSCVENAKLFLKWCKDFSSKREEREEERSKICDKMTTPPSAEHEELKKQLEALDIADPYPSLAEVIDNYTVKNDLIWRQSFFEVDTDLVVFIQLWLRDAGLAKEVHGWFWGGGEWSTYATVPDGGLLWQEVCLFDPSELLAFKSNSAQKLFVYDRIQTYDKFWAQDMVTTMQKSKDKYGSAFELNFPYPMHN